MNLRRLGGSYAVCRLPADEPFPVPPPATDLVFSVTRTARELSVVCPRELAPAGALVEEPWTAFEVGGPLAFSLVGVLAGLTGALAAANISVFAVSTYDTDYLLVPEHEADAATAALTDAGHELS